MRFIKPDDTVDHIMSKWNAVKYVFCFGTVMAPVVVAQRKHQCSLHVFMYDVWGKSSENVLHVK